MNKDAQSFAVIWKSSIINVCVIKDLHLINKHALNLSPCKLENTLQLCVHQNNKFSRDAWSRQVQIILQEAKLVGIAVTGRVGSHPLLHPSTIVAAAVRQV